MSYKELIVIFADSHKIIISKVHSKIIDNYGLNLDINRMKWWSVAPDILPQYKIVRHYKDESLDYIIDEIIKVIYLSRCLELSSSMLDPIAIKLLSKKIGIISHYISDYYCLPHAKRWTFKEDFIKHVKYENNLNKIAKQDKISINKNIEKLEINYSDISDLRDKIKSYINNIEIEYLLKEGYYNDLNFAYTANLLIIEFIIEAIENYSQDIYREYAFNL